MTAKITKAQEIKRLTTPLTFKQSRAYDCEGNLIGCVETLSDVKCYCVTDLESFEKTIEELK